MSVQQIPMRLFFCAFVCSILFSAAASFSGCASGEHQDRVVIPSATINGQPAHFVLDSGSSVTLIEKSVANRLKIKSVPSSPHLDFSWFDATLGLTMSEPVQLAHGNDTLTSSLPVSKFPWADFDVLVGWPDVRDNILFFDSASHTVRRVETLPPETAQWTKLKIHPADTLSMEVPLPDHRTGVLEVDTGNPTGVVLPPADFQKWKDAHPNNPGYEHTYHLLLLSVTFFKTIQADEFEVGPLKLNNVTLNKADWKNMADNYIGTLGLDTFERLDMVVDCKNGWAYLHPKPLTSEPVHPQDWTLDANVHISANHMLAFAAASRALLKEDQDDPTGAIEEYSTAIKLSPTSMDFYYARAQDQLGLGNFAEARADFDQFIQMHPQDAEYPRLFAHLLRLRLGLPPSDLDQNIAEWKDSWVKTVAQFLLGQKDEPTLLAAAEKADKEPVNGQRCEAYFYIGEIRLLHNDPTSAREFFKKSVATDQKDYVEYSFAKAELKRLDKNTAK